MANWRTRAYGRPAFMGFEPDSGDYIPPRRVSSNDTRFPVWSEPVPKTHKYPWNDLRLPSTKTSQVCAVFTITIVDC